MTALELTLCCIGGWAVVGLVGNAVYVIYKEIHKRQLAALRRQRQAERNRKQGFIDLMEANK